MIKTPAQIRAEARATLRKASEELQKLKATPPLALGVKAKADPMGLVRDVFSIVEGITAAVFTLAEEPKPPEFATIQTGAGIQVIPQPVVVCDGSCTICHCGRYGEVQRG